MRLNLCASSRGVFSRRRPAATSTRQSSRTQSPSPINAEKLENVSAAVLTTPTCPVAARGLAPAHIISCRLHSQGNGFGCLNSWSRLILVHFAEVATSRYRLVAVGGCHLLQRMGYGRSSHHAWRFVRQTRPSSWSCELSYVQAVDRTSDFSKRCGATASVIAQRCKGLQQIRTTINTVLKFIRHKKNDTFWQASSRRTTNCKHQYALSTLSGTPSTIGLPRIC